MQRHALFVHIGRVAEHGDLVLDAPAEDRGVVDVLQDQLAKLLFRVFKESRILGHFQHRDLRPGQQTALVGQIVGGLRVLVMAQPHGVRPDLPDQVEVGGDLRGADRIIACGDVLMLGHAAQRRLLPV